MYDPRFAPAYPDRRLEQHATAHDYRRLRERLGLTHAVIVQPAAYGTDNRVTVDAIAALGAATTRGIAVLHPDASDALLDELHGGGIRGLRFSIHDPRTAAVSIDMLAPLARRIARLGWHVQLHMLAGQLVEHAATIDALQVPMVIDHMARLPQPSPASHAAFALGARWLAEGRAWVKLSGPYLDTRVGGPDYADATAIAREFVQRAPDRCVWGSDWPHPTERDKPDDARLLGLLAEWIPDEGVRRAVLADNPRRLYGF